MGARSNGMSLSFVILNFEQGMCPYWVPNMNMAHLFKLDNVQRTCTYFLSVTCTPRVNSLNCSCRNFHLSRNLMNKIIQLVWVFTERSNKPIPITSAEWKFMCRSFGSAGVAECRWKRRNDFMPKSRFCPFYAFAATAGGPAPNPKYQRRSFLGGRFQEGAAPLYSRASPWFYQMLDLIELWGKRPHFLF